MRLQVLGWQIVVVYLNNIIIYSFNKQDHWSDLKPFMDLLKRNHIVTKSSKCQFMYQEGVFLVHAFLKDGNKTQNSQILSYSKILPPQDKDQLRAFLGINIYKRRLITNCGEITAPYPRPSAIRDYSYGPLSRATVSRAEAPTLFCTHPVVPSL